MTTFTLAIDFGTTWTAAAVHTDSTVSRLDFAGETRLPSLIWIDDDGNPQVGQAALHQWAMAPERLLAEPKAHLGELESIMIGGQRHKVSELVGAVLARVVEEARQRQGADPGEVRLTHPARWGTRRKQALVEAAESAGISESQLISEPEAAALWLANKLEEGERLAVYDLGGGTFDTAVLERTAEGFVLRGEPGGDEHLGGERFDDRLLGLVGSQIAPEHPEAWQHLQTRDSPGWAKRAADLRADVRQAKESLSYAESSYISVPVGGDVDEQPLLIRRSELEELIDDDTRRSYDLLDETIARAELEPRDLQGIYLTGGSSQLRLVRDLGQQRYANLQIRDDPKSVVALGAAGAQRLAEAGTVVEDETPEPVASREPVASPKRPPPVQPPQSATLPAEQLPVAQSRPGPSGPRAGFWDRFGASFLDGLIVAVVPFIVAGFVESLGLVLWLLVDLAYFSYFEGGPTGQTPGKRAVKIRVIDFPTSGASGRSDTGGVSYVRSGVSCPGSSSTSATCGCFGTPRSRPGTTRWPASSWCRPLPFRHLPPSVRHSTDCGDKAAATSPPLRSAEQTG